MLLIMLITFDDQADVIFHTRTEPAETDAADAKLPRNNKKHQQHHQFSSNLEISLIVKSDEHY